jgi:Zn-dependent peptidase ImmA (M78 family)
MSILSFRNDSRISEEDRQKLREFCSTLGGDAVALANRLGLKVFRETLPDDDDGRLVYDLDLGSESGFAIIVNGSKPLSRQIFTVAHEIGHFVLHRGEKEFKDNLSRTPKIVKSHRVSNVVQLQITRRSTLSSLVGGKSFHLNNFGRRLEDEADAFAANLLLPANLVRKTPEYLNGEPFALARRLGLSGTFVLRRFEELEFS